MRLVGKFFRLLQIQFILLKYGLGRPWLLLSKNEQPDPKSIRLALEALGPIFVKFGQILSTRRDLLPDDLAAELAKLQDCVPPFDGALAQKMIELSLEQPIGSLFLEFNNTPLASASISQVHGATLHDGSKVVVKVLRPKVAYHIERDVELMEWFAKVLFKVVPHSRRFRPKEVVAEIKRTLFDELDLFREAANASQLRRNFADNTSLYVPQVHWQHCRKNVMVMERVHGVPISDITTLRAKGVNLKRLAERGVEIFFTQVFRDCFFHADMHPGNIFVLTDEPENPRYIAVDFGIMGTLGPEDQRYLGENFLAFFKRDYRRVAELHVQSGWVPPDTPINAFESAIRTVCEPIFEKPLKDISFGQTLLRLFQTARQFDMEVQPQLLLLQKTLLNIEGLGRQLYPELDLWQTAKPYLEKWMKKHYGIKAMLTQIKNKLPLWSDKMPDLPEAIYDIVRFWQNETHYLGYQKDAKLHRRVSLQKTRANPYPLLGATVLVCTTFFALSTPFAAFLYPYAPWVIGMGTGVGLICFFKTK